MTQDTNLLYKLIILYMLDKVDFPLTNSQIVEFVIDRQYTNYFTLQTAINDLVEEEMISVEEVRNTSQYHLLSAGHEAINMFGDRISDAIKKDVLDYCEANRFEMRKEVEITAEYYSMKNENKFEKDYYVHGVVKEKGNVLVDLTLNVPGEEDAIKICDRWKDDSSEVYAYLVEKLIFS